MRLWCHCKKICVAGPQRYNCSGGRHVIWMWKEAPKLVPTYLHRMKFVPMLLLFTSNLELLLSVCVCTVPAALTLCKPLGRLSISSRVLSMLRPLQGDRRPWSWLWKSEIINLTIHINMSKDLTDCVIRRPGGTDGVSGLWKVLLTNESPMVLHHFLWNLTTSVKPLSRWPHTLHTPSPSFPPPRHFPPTLRLKHTDGEFDVSKHIRRNNC